MIETTFSGEFFAEAFVTVELLVSKSLFHLLAPTLIDQMHPFFPELKQREDLIMKTLNPKRNPSTTPSIAESNSLIESQRHCIREVSCPVPLHSNYMTPTDSHLTSPSSWQGNRAFPLKWKLSKRKLRPTPKSRQAHKSVDIVVSESADGSQTTKFVGHELSNLNDFSVPVLDTITQDEVTYLVFSESPFYAEMGGQVGDSGTVFVNEKTHRVTNVMKEASGRFLHALQSGPQSPIVAEQSAVLNVDSGRRMAIQRHHTATHILHWALRDVLGDHIRQAGSLVEADRFAL